MTFGPLIGFEVGWLFWLSRVAAFASICNLFVSYAALFRPQLAGGWERMGLITALVVGLSGAELHWCEAVGPNQYAVYDR